MGKKGYKGRGLRQLKYMIRLLSNTYEKRSDSKFDSEDGPHQGTMRKTTGKLIMNCPRKTVIMCALRNVN